ncbi:helix-turn-helix domain-containing protein [Aureisphaera galaxeae]|uniref:helix-turn-helix domain-containing protein n=1 Tax=Aureisphaera galaxeae TaxID=1538023 RepID=UPI0023505E85|nr:helix-turn-helix domain-containing protein [Aureisphaera galaxeae]MDC8003391.1 helix-turn-helix domain-containing protein [Aureisphaera galaxeae]
MKLDLWSLLIILSICQGVFVFSILYLSKERRSKIENRYLSFILLAFIWYLAEFLAIRNVIKVNVNMFYGTRYGSWLLLGPLNYYYIQSITQKDWKFSLKKALHLLPFVAFVIIIPWLSNESLSQRQIHYGMLAVFDHRPKTVTAFEYLYSTVFYLQFIHLGCYLFFNMRTVSRYHKKLKDLYANIENIKWLKLFNILLLAVLLLVSLFLYLLFATEIYRREMDYIYVIPMGIFIYSVGYYLSGLKWASTPPQKTRYASSSLSENDKSDLKQKLDTLMEAEKPYLKNTLRLSDLAQLMKVSDHQLSQLINEQYHCSFFDFVNRYRIAEAKGLLIAQPKQTILQVVFDCGFNNKTSFVNAFKKFENKTPSAFRKEHLNTREG